jgi:hypothetical protein
LMRTHAAKSVSGVRQVRRAEPPSPRDAAGGVTTGWLCSITSGPTPTPAMRQEVARRCGPSARDLPGATRGRRRATPSARFERTEPIGGMTEGQL